MKHQKELIEKYKKVNRPFPYPLYSISITEKLSDKKQYYLIDLLSYPYYYIFLFFRYKFPVVMYEVDKNLLEYRKEVTAQYRESEKHKKSILYKLASPIVPAITLTIYRMFPDIFNPIILPLLSIPTPYGYVYTMMVLFVVTLFVLYGIIKRNNELKQALKKDGVRKVKVRITQKIKLPRKKKVEIFLLYLFLLLLSVPVFKLPKDIFSIVLSIPLSFLTVYSIWLALHIPFDYIQAIEILEELEY